MIGCTGDDESNDEWMQEYDAGKGCRIEMEDRDGHALGGMLQEGI